VVESWDEGRSIKGARKQTCHATPRPSRVVIPTSEINLTPIRIHFKIAENLLRFASSTYKLSPERYDLAEAKKDIRD